MNLKLSGLLFLVLFSWAHESYSQSELRLVNIGDFKTTNGDIIKDCMIGYRTLGELNAEKSNVVLWPTWFTGTSEQVISYGFTSSLIDTAGLFIVIVDALTNGVSSSPSNTADFPTISIRDMVNSQHSLLVNHLDISHLFAVIGISMGGMQTFEWVIAYPDFMDKAIPIVGSPKQSSYDLLVWKTMADLMTEAGQDPQRLEFAYKIAINILMMNARTPTLFAETHNPDNLDIYLENQYSQAMRSEDFLGGMNAMIPLDIYKSANCSFENVKNIIKADMLIISATQDHLVNPISAIQLSKELDADLVTLTSNCGHGAFGCETEKIKNATVEFLKDR
jgi:homoserine O-acetyltransferase